MDTSKVKNNRDANELTRAYLDAILVEPRYLDSAVPDLSMELFGQRFASPLMTAAFSHLGHTHPGGMVEMARGAALCDICNFAGMGDPEELEAILATGAKTVKIVKPYADRKEVYRRLEHAEQAGALAVGMDIDHSFGRTGYPDCVLGLDMKPVTAEELADFVQATRLPFVVKGVLSVQDAEKCAKAGVSAIMLSHHHGIVPYAIPPLMALPRLKAALGEDMLLFADCSIVTGADAFKYLALGAKAVCVGTCMLGDFKAQGAAGVKGYIDTMTDELRAMMARTASLRPDAIDSSVLWDSGTGMPL